MPCTDTPYHLIQRTAVRLCILLALFFVLLPIPAAIADDEVHREMEQRLEALINAARANPLEMAATVGLNPEQVLVDLPEMASILVHGLPPLAVDERLTAAARQHTGDMLGNDFIGHTSSDGRTLPDRLLQNGYEAMATGEDLGLVGFINFIDPQSAVFQVFSNLYRAELNPQRNRPRIILTTAANAIGIGFGSGVLTLDSVPFNVYLTTVDIATTPWDLADRIAAWINHLRSNPRATIHALGIDLAPYLFARADIGIFLDTPQAMLVSDGMLQQSAESHTWDMLQNNFIDTIGSDGRTLHQRLTEAGYEPIWATTAISLTGFAGDIGDAQAAAQRLAMAWVSADLDRYVNCGSGACMTLLNPDAEAMGIGLAAGGYVFDADPLAVLMGSLNLAVPEAGSETDPFILTVAVWDDRNGDGAYSFGEEYPGVAVRLSRYTPFGYFDIGTYTTNAGGEVLLPVTGTDHYQVTVTVPGQAPADYYIEPTDHLRIAHNAGAALPDGQI